MKVKGLFFIFALVAVATLISSLISAEPDPGKGGLLVNAGFESASQDPWYWWGEAGTGTYGSTECAHSGKKSLKVVADGGDFVPMGLLQDFECEGGEEIEVSVWAMSPTKSPLTNSNAFIKLEFWGEDPINPLEVLESEHATDAFDWKKVSVSSKAPKGVIKAKIGLFIWNPGSDHSGTVYFDDAKVSTGSPRLF
jgi:hypothetical protein